MNKHCEQNLPKALIWLAIATGLVLMLLLCGCASFWDNLNPEGVGGLVTDVLDDYRTNRVDDAESPAQPDYALDAVRYADLQWRHGGFNGSGADFDDRAQIADLSTHQNGMSYRWIKGGCEVFGASGKSDFNSTYACLFYKDSSGSWIGGKFDWISTDRTTRDFDNVNGHDGKPPYVGWNPQAFHASKERCFVIVKTDGTRRTNVIKEVR